MSTDAAMRWVRTPLSAEQRSHSLEQLTDAERDREPTDSFLAGRLLLRELAPDTAITATCPDCGREHGQPRLGDGRFASITHAGDVTVVAVADVPIGIDVEPDDADVPAMFARDVAGWTAIEAVLKADGRGLNIDPSAVLVHGPVASVGSMRYDLTYVETAPGFTTAVARAVR